MFQLLSLFLHFSSSLLFLIHITSQCLHLLSFIHEKKARLYFVCCCFIFSYCTMAHQFHVLRDYMADEGKREKFRKWRMRFPFMPALFLSGIRFEQIFYSGMRGENFQDYDFFVIFIWKLGLFWDIILILFEIS
jgi:hypothetical protein